MNKSIIIEIENNVRFFVYCPQCRKILYKTTVNEMTGVCRRVALNTVDSHNGFLGHNAEIVVRKISTNEVYKWTDENAITFF